MELSSQQTSEWGELDRKFSGMVARKAKAVANVLGLDDAMQEGRLALLAAMVGYDPLKGDLERYVSVVLTNTYRTLLAKSRTDRAVPKVHTESCDAAGRRTWNKAIRKPTSLSSMDGADDWLLKESSRNNPEEILSDHQMMDLAAQFDEDVYLDLRPMDQKVYRLFVETQGGVGGEGKYDHFSRFLEWMGGENFRTIPELCEILGDVSDRNKINYCFHRIRTVATKVARKSKFSDLTGAAVNSHRWPRVWISEQPYRDLEFVRGIIEKHQLDDEPVKDMHLRTDFYQIQSGCSRRIERYQWGVVLTLERDGRWRTMVIAGRFNPLSGDIFGSIGTRQSVPVSWYRRLVKTLKVKGL